MAGLLWGKQVERTVKRRALVGWEGATPPTAARVEVSRTSWTHSYGGRRRGRDRRRGPRGNRASPFGKLLGKVFGGEEEAVLDRGVIQKG